MLILGTEVFDPQMTQMERRLAALKSWKNVPYASGMRGSTESGRRTGDRDFRRAHRAEWQDASAVAKNGAFICVICALCGSNSGS